MQQFFYNYFAQAYGEGNYSACDYNDSVSCAAGGGATTGGGLAGTGFDIVLILTIACALIFAGLVIRIIRKRRKLRQELATVEENIDNEQYRQQ